MARYRGATYTAACGECGAVFEATHKIRADAQAEQCYDRHYPKRTRDLAEVMEEVKREIPDWDGGK